VQALDNVDFDAYAGEVVALVGENGAGKSTLMKILAGAYQKDSGHIRLEGKEVHITSPSHAQSMGIAMIYQELNLTPNQTVAANIFLSREQRRTGIWGRLGLVDRQRMEREASGYLARVGAEVAPDALVKHLSVAERQQVEVAKTLVVDARVIIMDEPTSSLGQDEVKTLFEIIQNLKAQQRAIIFITHRLEEVFTVADRITVMRDGQRVATLPIREASPDKIISLMVGHLVDQTFHRAPSTRNDVVLEVHDLTRVGEVENVSFSLRRGEILGIAGLVGAGRTEMVRLIFGADAKDAGQIFVDGHPVNIHSPEAAMRAGIGLVPEDRGHQGLVLMLPVCENIVMATLPHYARLGWINRGVLEKDSEDYVHRLDVRTPSLEQKAMFLSGGNQQKVVVAKWLLSKPKVLILDEPTRGIDVNAKAEIHALMLELAKSGMGILMISSELPEILAMSDRVLVMCEGRLAAILERHEATQERIMAYATGHVAEREMHDE
jgi:ABC-type sugar transport system ATPase subunit